VPNFRHPLPRLLTVSSEAVEQRCPPPLLVLPPGIRLAFELKHVYMSYIYRILFVNDPAVTELTALSTIVGDCWDGGPVQSVLYVQSNVKKRVH
jgi:hypothetical protein